jgi:hypothetical protein
MALSPLFIRGTLFRNGSGNVWYPHVIGKALKGGWGEGGNTIEVRKKSRPLQNKPSTVYGKLVSQQRKASPIDSGLLLTRDSETAGAAAACSDASSDGYTAPFFFRFCSISFRLAMSASTDRVIGSSS